MRWSGEGERWASGLHEAASNNILSRGSVGSHPQSLWCVNVAKLPLEKAASHILNDYHTAFRRLEINQP